MDLKCDGHSVGAIARDKDGRILMIRRAKYPFGFAPPAGHCDGHSYGTACFIEFEEETGLRVVGAPRPLILLNPIKNIACRRGGLRHNWQVFEVNWIGELKLKEDEVKWIGWMTVEEIKSFAQKTKEYLRKLKEAEKAEDQVLVNAIKDSIEKDWQKSPGLEVTWLEIFQELKVI